MRVETIEKDAAPADVLRVYEALEKTDGQVSNFHKMLAHRPDVLRAFNQLNGALWASGALAPRLKDLAYLRASILNGCEF
jgi:alkylhydroperoxidase family enzyme